MTRALDDTEQHSEKATDFIKRRRNGSLALSITLYAIAIILIGYISLQPEITKSGLKYMLTILSITAIPTIYAAYTVQRNLDVITGVEFQNALFSVAFDQDYDFSFFARKDGTIVQGASNVRRVFPDFKLNDAFESISIIMSLTNADKQKLLTSVNNNEKQHFVTEIIDSDGEKQPLSFTITALTRPKGHFLVKGRKYTKNRQETTNHQLNKNDFNEQKITSPEQNLLNHLEFGLCSTSPSGYIRAVNETLESWLGYESGEIIAKELMLYDLLYTADGKEGKSIEMQEIDDKVTLKKKNSSLLKTRIRQTIHKDSTGSISTAIATFYIHN